MRLEFNRTVTQDVDLRLCETKQKASNVVAFFFTHVHTCTGAGFMPGCACLTWNFHHRYLVRRIPSAIHSETAVRCWLVSSFKLNIGLIQTPKCPRVGKLAAEQLLVVLDILHVENIVNVAVHADCTKNGLKGICIKGYCRA